tara:strand:- start:69 stop:242 length:174 start_codon:yes stop_codon:yes gene_type:complete
MMVLVLVGDAALDFTFRLPFFCKYFATASGCSLFEFVPVVVKIRQINNDNTILQNYI